MGFVVFVRERTDTGLIRNQNEDFQGYFKPADAHVREAKGEIYVVCDGMGGYAAGELASMWAVQRIIYEYYSDLDPAHDPAASLRRAIEEANYGIYANATSDPSRQGMGSTVVAAVVWDDLLIVANVGDSRAYLVRDGQITQLTEDHSWVAEALSNGLITPEQARNHPNRNVLTRSLGGKPHVAVDIRNYRLLAGDTIILCTDGLHGVVEDAEIAQVAASADPTQIPANLIALANARGGPDNITVTALRLYDEAGPLPRGLSDTQPIEPTAPRDLADLRRTDLHRTPGVLEELIGLLRQYPVVRVAFGGSVVGIVILLALVLMRGGWNTPPGPRPTIIPTMVAASPTMTTPVMATNTSAPATVTTGTVLTLPNSLGRIAYVDPSGSLCVIGVISEMGKPRLDAPKKATCLNVTDAHHPTWSPDGTWLAFQRGTADTDGDIWVVQWDKKKLQFGIAYTLDIIGTYPAWSPLVTVGYSQKQWLAYSWRGRIYGCELESSQEKWKCKSPPYQLVSNCEDTADQGCADRYPAWSPDGKALVFARICDEGQPGINMWMGDDQGDIYTVTLALDAQTPLPATKWTPAGDTSNWNAFPSWGPLGIAWSKNCEGLNVVFGQSCWGGTGVQPSWGPDGKWIVCAYFTRTGGGDKDLALGFVRSDGSLKLCGDGTETQNGTDMMNGCSNRHFLGREPAWWWSR